MALGIKREVTYIFSKPPLHPLTCVWILRLISVQLLTAQDKTLLKLKSLFDEGIPDLTHFVFTKKLTELFAPSWDELSKALSEIKFSQ